MRGARKAKITKASTFGAVNQKIPGSPNSYDFWTLINKAGAQIQEAAMLGPINFQETLRQATRNPVPLFVQRSLRDAA